METNPVHARQPVFNVPFAVLLLLAVMIAVHVLRIYLPAEDMLWWLIALAFVPARYAGGLEVLPGGDIARITSPLTHIFVHADQVHLLFNGAWLLAFGTPLAKRLGTWRFLAFFLSCGLAGAGLFFILHPGLMAPVIGASGAIAGLMGGVMRFLFTAIDRHEWALLREDPAAIPLVPLARALRDRRLLIATGAFVGMNLLAIIGFGTFGEAGSIAWEAHLGGYFFGLICFAAFDIAARQVASIPPDSPYEGR